jgi:hypothetical protein
MPSAISSIPSLVKQLYVIVADLTRAFPGRRFTPDGHLVGSIGEVIAMHRYGLTLLEAGAPGHDAIAKNGARVQIKITQAKSVGLRSPPDHLIVLHLSPTGEDTEIYNGPGAAVWEECGSMQKNGQRSIGLSKLKKLMARVQTSEQLIRKKG